MDPSIILYPSSSHNFFFIAFTFSFCINCRHFSQVSIHLYLASFIACLESYFLNYFFLLVYCLFIFHSFISFSLHPFCNIDWLIHCFPWICCFVYLMYVLFHPFMNCSLFVSHLMCVHFFIYKYCLTMFFFTCRFLCLNPSRLNRQNVLLDHLSFWISLVPK